jgi:hypothetical protein
VARVVLDGTQVELHGHRIERDRLVELASSLVRVPAEPPRFFGDG